MDYISEFHRLWERFASDDLRGRRFDSETGYKATEILAELFADCGLIPIPGSSDFSQPVPISRTSFIGEAQWALLANGEKISPRPQSEAFVRAHSSECTRLHLQSAMVVFAGHGAYARELGIDDLAGLDVKGKVVALLHGYADPRLNELESGYHDRGRWTTKVRTVRQRGAAGVMFLCASPPSGQPFSLLSDTLRDETASLAGEDTGEVFAEFWLEGDFTARLLLLVANDIGSLVERANRRDFRPGALANLTVSIDAPLMSQRVHSKNIVGRKPGRKDQRGSVLVMAHWDHLGAENALADARIFNGAIDNASGMAGLAMVSRLLEQTATERSIIFLSTTGEESGFLGARHFVKCQLQGTLSVDAVINLDALFPLGRTRDFKVVGWGLTTLDELVDQAAKEYGKYVRPDPLKANYTGSDHICFAQAGIPALQITTGIDLADGGPDFGQKRRNDLKKRIHTQHDVFDEKWDVESVFEDVRIVAHLMMLIANSSVKPTWRPCAPFAPDPSRDVRNHRGEAQP